VGALVMERQPSSVAWAVYPLRRRSRTEQEHHTMPPPPDEPILLSGAQSDASANLLARAFQDDPLMGHVLPNAQRRERLLPVLFRIVVRYCLRYGAIYTTSAFEGVVCCLPPGQSITVGRLARMSLSDPPLQLGPTSLRRFLRASSALPALVIRRTNGRRRERTGLSWLWGVIQLARATDSAASSCGPCCGAPGRRASDATSTLRIHAMCLSTGDSAFAR
jgi:hypothetical protein